MTACVRAHVCVRVSIYTGSPLSGVAVIKHVGKTAAFLTIIAKAVKTGTGTALIHIDFTAGAGEALATVTAETQRKTLLIQLLHTHSAILARIAGLAG